MSESSRIFNIRLSFSSTFKLKASRAESRVTCEVLSRISQRNIGTHPQNLVTVCSVLYEPVVDCMECYQLVCGNSSDSHAAPSQVLASLWAKCRVLGRHGQDIHFTSTHSEPWRNGNLR